MICRPDFAAAARREGRLDHRQAMVDLTNVVPFRPRAAAMARPASSGLANGTMAMLATVAVLNVMFWTMVGNAALHSLA